VFLAGLTEGGIIYTVDYDHVTPMGLSGSEMLGMALP
jgi:hypothetical protein